MKNIKMKAGEETAETRAQAEANKARESAENTVKYIKDTKEEKTNYLRTIILRIR